jgi:hypothetical protein
VCDSAFLEIFRGIDDVALDGFAAEDAGEFVGEIRNDVFQCQFALDGVPVHAHTSYLAG